MQSARDVDSIGRPHQYVAVVACARMKKRHSTIIKQVSNKGSATKVSKELRMVRLLFLPSQVESAVEQLQRLAEPVRQWALQGVVDLRAVL